MNSLWSSSRAASDANADANAPAPANKPEDQMDVAVVADIGPEHQSDQPVPRPSVRPLLQRNTSAQPPPPAVPPPLNQPPPPPVANGPQPPSDSLSLAQLRRIVAEFPRAEAIAYDFTYEDMGPLDEEIDEWFVYQPWQWERLKAAQRAFESHWDTNLGPTTSWDDLEQEAKKKYVAESLADLSSSESAQRASSLGRLVYVILGRWGQTAGAPASGKEKDTKARSPSTPAQLTAMKAAAKLVGDVGGVATIWDALRKAFDPFWTDDPQPTQGTSSQEAQNELGNLMTVMYMITQHALAFPEELTALSSQLLELDPSLVVFFVDVVARMRWDEAQVVPQAQVFLLFWKSIFLVFGGSKELKETKKATAEVPDDAKEKDIITASPLDYHFFRQEIISKYPAYIPPREVIPLEPDNTSLLPPLPNQTPRNNGASGILPPQPGTQAGGASILHQPVHIATPAPSPPPSPGVGGKGVKKQNYQTNQNFPFMYPPLDATSNSAGGKGNAALQAFLVGRKWEGSDVPASILEAGELFSNRVRMTRALRQLWEEREKFMKFERGWDAEDNDILEELDLSSLTLEEKEELGLVKPKRDHFEEATVDYGPHPEQLSPRIKQRLEAVETFYAASIPQLQSVCMCLIKGILAHYTVLLSQQPPAPVFGPAPGNNGRPNGANGNSNNANNNHHNPGTHDNPEPSAEEVDAARTREITAKAVTGIMLLLLKWLKLSHVLKFEFLTQLLLDCNYMPLVLKLFLHQDVQQVVENKTDRLEKSFFHLCNVCAGASERPPEDPPAEGSEDDAAPPPIKRRRSPPSGGVPGDNAMDAAGQQQQEGGPGGKPMRPEVDELGYPVNPLPTEPITDFSRRNFFTLINYLRILQKICKNKSHRNLLMVQYKSSQVLRKNLRVPQPELRLYTLKLYKNQVPYCSRKWRQSNMRVLTAVYLHCRPELRDAWLAGCDVDAEMEEALPLEQALRGLAHWFNVRRYPGQMAPEVRAALSEEQDFFVRELEKLEGCWEEVVGGGAGPEGGGGGGGGGHGGEWEEMHAWG